MKNILYPSILVVGLIMSATTSKAVIFSDFDSTNVFGTSATKVVGNVDADPDNEFTVTAAAGFTAAFSTSIPRSGGMMDVLRNNDLFQFQYQSKDADNAGTYINLFVVLQTDAWSSVGVNGNDFNVLDGANQFVAPNADVGPSNFSFNIKTIGADPVNAVLDSYAGGAGGFMNLFIIQQSDAQTVISYDDFGMVAVPEPSTFAAIAGLLVLGVAFIRRRR